MPKAVSGYKLADGRFFEDESIANYEDTKQQLYEGASSSVQVTADNFPAFLDFIEANAQLVTMHCHHVQILAQEGAAEQDVIAEMQKEKEI